MWAWLDANPIVILTLAILVIVMMVRSLVKNQGGAIIKLIEAVTKNADNVSKLEVLYREQITPTAKSVFKIDKQQDDIHALLVDIRALVIEALSLCKEKETE